MAKLSARNLRTVKEMCPVSKSVGLASYLDMLLAGPGQVGNIYFVDPLSGSDVNDGKSGDKAKATMQAGITLCDNNHGDVIVRMRGGEAVTSVVDFNKSGVTVIPEGYGGPMAAMGEYFSTYSTTLTGDPTAKVTADGVTIAGIAFVGVDAGTTHYFGAALLIGGLATAAPYGTRIVNCRFPKWNLANRIGVAVEGTSECLIEGCDFEGVGADFASGIYVQGATQNLNIIGNHFRSCTYGVLYGPFAGGGPHAIIKSNVFEDAKILSATTAAPTHVCDNWSELAVGTGSFSGNYATLAGLGIYCSDNHYAEAD